MYAAAMDAATFGLIIGYAIGAGVFLLALYVVIRLAVLHALRDNVVSSVTSVKISASVPLRLAADDSEVDAPGAQR